MEKIFYPKSVAVVGASNSKDNMGRNIVSNLESWGFSGDVYPVNPKGEDVMGWKGYPSIKAIPGAVDMVVAFVPARVVPGILDQCAEKGVRRMAIPSGGFSEFGESGDELTRVLRQKAGKYKIRFVGPNGLTVINNENGLCLPFITLRKRPLGGISIISQSGGVGLSLLMFLDNTSTGFNKFVSVGNKVDMDESDFLEYLGRDRKTSVICMFLESIARGREFARSVSSTDKPVIVYKANNTEAGARTAAGHTAALANDDAVLDGVFRQKNVIRVRSIKRLVGLARAFELPLMRGNRIAVVSQAGGYAVVAADEAHRHGFEFAAFSNELLDGFREHVRSDVINMGNPLDLGDVHSSDAIAFTLDRIMALENVDGVVAILLRRAHSAYDGAYSGLSREMYGDIGKAIKKYDKPLALGLMTQCDYLRDVQGRMDFPVFESPEEAVGALAALRDHYRQTR